MPQPADNLPPAVQTEPLAVTDRSLMRRLQSGQPDAATDLYRRYAQRLRNLASGHMSARLARQLEADDVVQSVFRTFFRRVAEGRYEVPAGDEIWGLFLVIALNKIRAAGVHHTAARRDMGRTRSLCTQASDPPDPCDDVMTLRLVVSELLARMPVKQQQIVTLRVDGHRVEEISTAVGRSRRTVERVLQQFRRKLKQELQPEDTGHHGGRVS